MKCDWYVYNNLLWVCAPFTFCSQIYLHVTYTHIIGSKCLQKVAIIVGYSNYGTYEIQITWLNMKYVWMCAEYVSDTLSRMSHLTNDDGALNEVGCFLFACKLWMYTSFVTHLALYLWLSKRRKLLRWKTWNSHLFLIMIIWEKEIAGIWSWG